MGGITNDPAVGLTAHSALVGEIAQRLSHDGWNVDVEPRIDGYVPDLVVQHGDSAIVIEVKANEDTVHFAALGQAAAYKRSIDERVSTPTDAVVVSTGVANDEIRRLAGELSVELVTVPADDVGEAAALAVAQLKQLASTEDPAPPVP